MTARRALVGAVVLALGLAVWPAAGALTAAVKKHPPMKTTSGRKKSGKASSKKGGKAPVARTVVARGSKTKRQQLVKVSRTSGSAGRTATVIHADLPEGGREAMISRITEELANAKVGIENPAALQGLFEKLSQLEQDPKSTLVRVIQFGDSHTAADIFTGALRSLFQTKFGDGGAGFQFAGYPFAGYRIHGTKRAQSTGWVALGTHLRDIGDGLVGMGGVSLSTEAAGSWVSVDADATSLEVQYLKQPGGGSFEVRDGETLLGTVSTNGPEGAGHFDATVEAGPHHFEVLTTESAPVRLLGLVTDNGAGATYEAAGINGAEASLFLRWNEAVQQALMTANEPALIVLSYGTNEASDHNWTEEGYAAMFRQIIARCRRLAPDASILVVGPPDRALRVGRHGWAPFAGVDRIVQAQRGVCKQMGCAYWDQRRRMGGFGSMRDWVSVQWAQGDHTHFTAEGYDELASALFLDIVTQYNTYRGTQGLTTVSSVEGDVR